MSISNDHICSFCGTQHAADQLYCDENSIAVQETSFLGSLKPDKSEALTLENAKTKPSFEHQQSTTAKVEDLDPIQSDFQKKNQRLAIPNKIKQYRLARSIGQGGMASVFLGVDDLSGHQVAIKILPRKMAQDADLVARFLDEARALASLDHENIIPLLSYFEEDGGYYLIMKYVEGQDLSARIKEYKKAGKKIRFSEIQFIIGKILSALDYAHKKGVIHRDIKPANILLTADNKVYLVDFGIAKQEGNNQLTQTGLLMGTPQYMSPEQITGQTLDGRCDLYSVGLTLFEMLTGKPPFQDEKTYAILKAHIEDPVPDPRQYRDQEIPSKLLFLLAQLLEKDPNDRPNSAAECIKLLESPPFFSKSQLFNKAPVKSGLATHAQTPITGSSSSFEFELSDAILVAAEKNFAKKLQSGSQLIKFLKRILLIIPILLIALYFIYPDKADKLLAKLRNNTEETQFSKIEKDKAHTENPKVKEDILSQNEVDRLLKRAAALMQKQKFKTALTLLEEGLEPTDSLRAEVVVMRIKALIGLKKWTPAIRWLYALESTPFLDEKMQAEAASLRESLQKSVNFKMMPSILQKEQ